MAQIAIVILILMRILIKNNLAVFAMEMFRKISRCPMVQLIREIYEWHRELLHWFFNHSDRSYYKYGGLGKVRGIN